MLTLTRGVTGWFFKPLGTELVLDILVLVLVQQSRGITCKTIKKNKKKNRKLFYICDTLETLVTVYHLLVTALN